MTTSTAVATAATPSTTNVKSLYYFATPLDVVLIIFGCIFKACFGAAQVLVLLVFGQFFDLSAWANMSLSEFGVFMFASMCYFGAASAVAEGLGTMLLKIAENRQMTMWKKEYLKSILRQDVGWYDTNRPQELSTRMGESLVHLEKGLHPGCLGAIFGGCATLFTGLVIGVIYKWDLALVTLALCLLSYVPAASYLFNALDKLTKRRADAYAGAGGVASESLSGLRTIASFGLEPVAIQRYEGHLNSAQTAVSKLMRSIAFALATMNSSMFYVLAVGAVYATFLIYNDYTRTGFGFEVPNGTVLTEYCAYDCDEYDLFNVVSVSTSCTELDKPVVQFQINCGTGGIIHSNQTMLEQFMGWAGIPADDAKSDFEDIFEKNDSKWECSISLISYYISVQAIFQAVFGFAQVSQPVQTFLKAARAGRDVLKTIARVPPIDSFSEEGVQLSNVKGDIHVKDVTFAYPASPTFNICNGYTLHIPAGSSCALVGPSGAGKSTIIALLERFYDPQSGCVEIDGVDIKTVNVKSLRSVLGLVSQEPTLFLGTVKENILVGKPGASDEEVEKAAKAANAHDFITNNLAEGYATQVGLGGSKLSGGQKQRVAIARAMIKAPSIMLLDEATSALDNASEKVVQVALDEIMSKGSFTSVTIAHRLTTIKHSDKIAVVQKGVIVEEGTYDELLAIGEGGVFHMLAAKQEKNLTDDQQRMNEMGGSKSEPNTPNIRPADGVGVVEGTVVGATSLEIEEPKDADGKKKKKPKQPDPMGRLFKSTGQGDGILYFVGIVSGGMTGIGKGMFGLLMMRSITAVASYDPATVLHDGLFWSIVFLVVGAVMHFFETLNQTCLSIAGERLIKNLRLELLTTLLHFEIGYFDVEENSMGNLTEFLGEKVALMQGLVGEKLGMLAQSMVMLVTVLVTMFVWGDWRVTLVVLGCMPIMGVLMSIAMAAMMPMDQAKAGKKENDQDAKKSAGSLIGEVVLGIRTVASFTAEIKFYGDYCAQVDELFNKGKLRSITGAAVNGVAMGGTYIIFGFQLWYGFYLADVGAIGGGASGEDCNSENFGVVMDKIMVPLMAMMMVMMMASGMAMMATDAAAAAEAAKQLFERFDRPSLCDPFSDEGQKLEGGVKGDIDVKDVHFSYPTAPNLVVMSGYSLCVKAGDVCALCGPSGSGKSTVINLILRFYDPYSGSLNIDGVDIKTMNVKWLRQQLGLVGQEPVLFEGTVAENIAHGKLGSTQDEIEEAARAANAHTFITNDLGDGYKTEVGLRGGKLSGGQKQRVAIARALVRKPSIMLLDEATSALDNESEKVVQAALDEIMSKQKRTTITIAHRLSTIRNADAIAVVQAGKVVEQGTHDELLGIGRRGVYFGLVEAQA